MNFKGFNIIIILLFLGKLHGQQEIIFTKYIYHSLLFNPAYAGCHGFDQGTAMIQYRNQWLGLEGAPTTLLGSFEKSFAKDRLGLGISIGNESIGIDNRSDISTNFAYRIPIGKGNLAAGIRVAFSQYNADFGKLNNVNTNDPLYNNSNAQFSIFSAGFGLYYNDPDFYVGLSMPSIRALSNSDKASYKANHLYLHMGTMMGAETGLINVEPSILLAFQKAAPIQYTMGVNLWFNRQFAIGAHLRSEDAFALSSEVFLNNKLRLCLAYDFTISDIRRFENGSLEIMMAYHLYKKSRTNKIKHIRYGGRF